MKERRWILLPDGDIPAPPCLCHTLHRREQDKHLKEEPGLKLFTTIIRYFTPDLPFKKFQKLQKKREREREDADIYIEPTLQN